jgi:hypothetical protein
MIVTMRSSLQAASKNRPTLLRPSQCTTARPVSLLITVLILHVLSSFDNRLLVTEKRSTDGSNQFGSVPVGYLSYLALRSGNLTPVNGDL